ncbi:hypothetical protein OG884_15740 [Streptosporangium sp. NBC_01755]|uniref:hypothetical protein n=1 Tax=Streptosporangium sp. NBC_01755 TaxID=2975949 RepID=UPI002DDA4C28|nr:hypothetical protein [Streptosporangium sp. NBC_01755]WSD03286.1 hypothetical protein OG884_15740 [Streptosporangium sp. NBC_01755]
MAEINVPTGPIETEPYNAIRTAPGESLTAACRTALLRELGGMEAGAWDDELLGWLANQDPSVVATVCSWLRRVRALPPPTAPTVRGGPELDDATEAEYRAEQNDYTPEEQA